VDDDTADAPMSGCRVRYPMARVRFASGNRLERRAEVAVDRLDERVGYGLVGHRAGVDAVEAEERAERRGRARWSRRRVRKRRNGSRRQGREQGVDIEIPPRP